MIDVSVFLGKPLSFNNILIYPPKVSDAIDIEFFRIIKVLTLSQEEVEDAFQEANKKDKTPIPNPMPTPLEYLLNNAKVSQSYERLVIKAFDLFTKQKISLLYKAKSILVGDIEQQISSANTLQDLTILNETNFFDFQNTIRLSLGDKPVEPPDPNMPLKLKMMKAKARYRDKVKAESGGGISLGGSIAAICCMNMGLNPLNIEQLSYASIGILTKMYQGKESYETDIKSLLAGADAKKVKPKYWIKDI